MSRLPQSGAEVTGQAAAGVPGRVRVLPDDLVDQIAAGEVVERPASVAKELVENALDAGAARIRVEVRGGGVDWIAVADDGCGMTPGDARLALERHATSKLRDARDLVGIRSFGFRGEALPAIASVSRLRLRTRPRGAAEGFELRVESGRLVEARAAGGPEGTRVEVADLFAAVPARRKFLKSPVTEWGHVADWLGRAALALPGVHFEVRRDDRDALVWPAVADPLDRIAAVLSEADASALEAVEREAPGAGLRAFVSHPGHHRPTAAGIHLFVDGRPVRDRLLRHALLQVYRDVLPRGRFPVALVFLTLPPGAVDVNVHPAKWEVRFADPQAIHRLLRSAVEEALARRGWLRGRAGGPTGSAGRVAEPAAGDWILAGGGETAREDRGVPAQIPLAGAPAARDTLRPLRFGELQPLGQLFATYLVLEEKDGLLLVDQHAAHERVLYERLRAAWLAGGVERQVLLLPAAVEMEPASAEALASGTALALRLGFEVEPFGPAAVVVRAVPALLAERDPAGLVRDLAEELRAAQALDGEVEASPRLLAAAERGFATLACHAARRAGDVLEPREQRALLEALDTIPWAPTCPHGRPVAVALSLAEIERRFGRR